MNKKKIVESSLAEGGHPATEQSFPIYHSH